MTSAGGRARCYGRSGVRRLFPSRSPTVRTQTGPPSGSHRVVDPAGGTPHLATRLDVDPDVRAGECRIRLTALVLDATELAGFQRTFGEDPSSLRAALLEATSDRGGVPTALAGAVVLGAIDALAADAGRGDLALGTAVASPPPASALPLWVADVAAWDGSSPVAPAHGYAIVTSRAPIVTLPPDVAPAVAAELARVAHVPHAVARLVGPAAHVTVFDATGTAGALAVLESTAAGAEVAAVVTTLQEARLARVLGASRVVVADPAGMGETADLLMDGGWGPADVTVAASPDPAVLATAVRATDRDGTVLTFDARGLEDAAAVSSSFGARHRLVLATRGTPPGDRRAVERFSGIAAFRDLVRWRAGTGPLPAAGLPDDP